MKCDNFLYGKSKICQAIIFFWLFELFFYQNTFGQSNFFSQYYYPTPIFSNPAWVAVRQELFTGLHIRSQQIGVGQGINTQNFQFTLPFLDDYGQRVGGFGLGVLNEQAGKGGLLQTNAILGNLAYNLHFSDYDHLAFGMQGGYFFRRINPNRLTSESQ
ncbi:MAG: type IX secretion system membrane protein PorP/SprF, partial [Raineya sp.]